MFCCRPKLTGDEARVPNDGEPVKQAQLISKDAEKVKSHNTKTPVTADNEKFLNLMNKTTVIPRPRVDHVRSVRDNVYVKMSSLSPTQSLTRDKQKVYYVSRDGKCTMVGVSPPKTNASVSRSNSCHYTNLSIPRAKLSVNRSMSYRAQPTHTIHRISTEFVRNPINDSPNNNTEHETGTDKRRDNDSLTKEQFDVLEQLDDTLKEFNTGAFDDVTPTIVADVLPYGVFEADEKFDSGLESDETPSSRTSSLSSNKSLSSKSGIISNSKGKRDRRVPSVSFNLPPDHVDKPYQPMQSHRQKVVHAPTQILVTDYKSKVWHTNDQAYVEDKIVRRSSGPFKGSFKQLFYGKYAPKELRPRDDGTLHVSPMIMERVNSFENLNEYGSGEHTWTSSQ